MTTTTLVIGARGSIGRHVVDLLLAAGETVRASVRNPALADLPKEVSIVAADLTKPQTLKTALEGVAKVFLYAPTDDVDSFITAARESNLEHIVLMSSGSVLLPLAGKNAIAKEHHEVEQVFEAEGLPFTPIRPLVLANNALNWSHSIRTEGVARLLYPEAVMAPIHEYDIASVAVAALLGQDRAKASAMLTGPEHLTQRQQVELIGRETGQEIRVEEMSEEQARERFGKFEKPETVEAIIELLKDATAGGSPVTDAVERVLGRPALPFSQWVKDHSANFR